MKSKFRFFAKVGFLGPITLILIKRKKTQKPVLYISSCTAKLKTKITEAVHISESVNFSRWLGDQPGNKLTPTKLANFVKKEVAGTGIKATIWDKKKIAAAKMGGIMSVSAGSHEEPRLIFLEYRNAAASKKPLLLVGKGLTFDSGGISIKPSRGMEEMKFDMCGGANVIGAILAIAKLKLKVNVVAVVPSSENMTGDNATRPGDVVTAHNGKTVEVNNTDAEGRLILMDALSYATKKYSPSAVVDVATLTGAMVVALGNIYTGVFARDEKLLKTIQKAGKKSEELLWPMPIHDFHRKDMKGTYADLSNISSAMGAGSSTAAAFLSFFVDKKIPWAHFDIAGTAWHTGSRLPYCPPKGATGVLVRTFVELAREHFKA